MTAVNRPTVRQLEYFVAVSRFGSFRKAADELGISQPTVTAQVAQMEKALAVVLFERGRGGATLTPAGRQLLPIARRTLEEMDNLLATAGVASSGAAVYRLGVKSTLGPYILPRILPALHARYRDLKLYVREEQPSRLEAALENGDLDLVLTALPTNSSELDGEQLLREDIRLVLPADHTLATKAVLKPADMEGAQILTTQGGHKLTRMVEQIAGRLGAEVLRDYEGTSLDALRLMVVMGMGLAFLPALYIRSEITAESGLVVRDIEGESFARIVGLAWRSTSPARVFYRQLAQDMREVLREELGDVIQVLDRNA